MTGASLMTRKRKGKIKRRTRRGIFEFGNGSC
jgi:hypothetical protein